MVLSRLALAAMIQLQQLGLLLPDPRQIEDRRVTSFRHSRTNKQSVGRRNYGISTVIRDCFIFVCRDKAAFLIFFFQRFRLSFFVCLACAFKIYSAQFTGFWWRGMPLNLKGICELRELCIRGSILFFVAFFNIF